MRKQVARLEGLEPPTHGLEGRCSIQLSYRRVLEFSLLAARSSSDEAYCAGDSIHCAARKGGVQLTRTSAVMAS
jgi:hypothetical protein